MSDSKRRKQLDPNYGKGFGRIKPNIDVKGAKPSLELQVSKLTGNFLIVCSNTGFCIDSASKELDANLIVETVLSLLKTYPMQKFTTSNWTQWMKLHHQKIPNVDAVVFTSLDLSRRMMYSEAIGVDAEVDAES